MVIVNLILFILGCIVLVKSGTWLVKSVTKISSFFSLGEFIFGFLVMAIATSIPELMVGIVSAIEKNTPLILGTVIGSNILDLTLVIGVVILLGRGITVKSITIRKDCVNMFVLALLPLLLFLIGKEISRLDGLVLLIICGGYIYRLLKQKSYFRNEINNVSATELFANSGLFFLSLVLLFLSSEFIVRTAQALSIELGLPQILIGLVLLAFGTSLPELVFETKAVLKGISDMAIGDVIGSVIMNSTLVLGIASIIHPITANFFMFVLSSIFLFLSMSLFLVFLFSNNKLTWKEGVVFIFFSLIFIIVELYFGITSF